MYRRALSSPPDPEELCGGDGEGPPPGPVSGAPDLSAVLQRAQAAEDRAQRAEEALARAMDDLHKLKFVLLLVSISSILLLL